MSKHSQQYECKYARLRIYLFYSNQHRMSIELSTRRDQSIYIVPFSIQSILSRKYLLILSLIKENI